MKNYIGIALHAVVSRLSLMSSVARNFTSSRLVVVIVRNILANSSLFTSAASAHTKTLPQQRCADHMASEISQTIFAIPKYRSVLLFDIRAPCTSPIPAHQTNVTAPTFRNTVPNSHHQIPACTLHPRRPVPFGNIGEHLRLITNPCANCLETVLADFVALQRTLEVVRDLRRLAATPERRSGEPLGMIVPLAASAITTWLRCQQRR